MRNPIKMNRNLIATANPPYPTVAPRQSLPGAKIHHGIPNELHNLMVDIVDLLKYANQGSDAELRQAKQQLKASLQATQCALQAMNATPESAGQLNARPLRPGASAAQSSLATI